MAAISNQTCYPPSYNIITLTRYCFCPVIMTPRPVCFSTITLGHRCTTIGIINSGVVVLTFFFAVCLQLLHTSTPVFFIAVQHLACVHFFFQDSAKLDLKEPFDVLVWP